MVRDSAGITIVESTDPAWADRTDSTSWIDAVERWTLVPNLRIGSVDDPQYSLTRVHRLLVDASGTIYVLQPLEQTIRAFNAEGQFIRTIGRRGEGPGEFGRPVRLGWKGDTLWVMDELPRRISFFTRRGDHLSTFIIPFSAGGDRPLSPIGVLADGSVLAQPRRSTHEVSSGILRSLPLVRISRSSAGTDTVARFSVEHRVLELRREGGITFTRQPLSDETLYAIAPDGTSLTLVDRPAAADGSAARFHVTRIAPAGDTIVSRHYRYTPKPLGRSLLDNLVSDFLADHMSIAQGFGTPARAEEAVRQALYAPDHLPPISGLVIGRDGTIWLRREELGVSQVEWLVLDARGDIIASFAEPPGLEILQAQRDIVWGVVRDEFDVPYVVRYQVQRAEIDHSR